MLDGCQIFPAGDYYNRVVTTAPVDANSAAMIKATADAGDTGGLNMWHPSSLYLNIANSATPTLNVRPISGGHNPVIGNNSSQAIPWLSTFKIQSVSDKHSFTLNTSNCTEYETWDTSYTNGVLSAYSGLAMNLSQPMLPQESFAAVTAAGIPMLPGLVRPEEIVAGAIHHALYFDAVYGTLNQTRYVAPSFNADGVPYKGPASETANALPLGARLRLRSNFPMSELGPQAQVIARALQTYGALVADTGCCDALQYVLSPTYPGDPFNGSDLNTLSNIHISDFQVVDSP